MIRKILGPPGTGKTTKLLHYVRTLVKFGVPLYRIGYFAFTRKASQEAVNRACSKFSVDRKEFSNFRTLQKGEYISLDVEDGTNGLQGVNITGVFGGPLMCDNVIYRNNYRNNKFSQNNSTEHSTLGNTEMMES